jgi:hypothetical protein
VSEPQLCGCRSGSLKRQQSNKGSLELGESTPKLNHVVAGKSQFIVISVGHRTW